MALICSVMQLKGKMLFDAAGKSCRGGRGVSFLWRLAACGRCSKPHHPTSNELALEQTQAHTVARHWDLASELRASQMRFLVCYLNFVILRGGAVRPAASRLLT